MAIEVTLYSDPGCPWAYCANPALTTLQWRYRDQLRWRLVTIGLSEDTSRYRARGYTPERQATRYQTFRRRFGMAFTAQPRPRLVSTGRACRAIVATRLAHPGREFAVLRALQFGWFCHSSILGDTDAGILEAIGDVRGIDPQRVVRLIDSEKVERAYQADRAETRSAAGGPADLQGKTANTDGLVRFTAPSVVLELNGKRLQAGGFQSLDAYDVCVANLDPALERRAAAPNPLSALSFFGEGLTTAEVAQLMTRELDDPDRAETGKALTELLEAGVVHRRPLGQDELWTAAGAG